MVRAKYPAVKLVALSGFSHARSHVGVNSSLASTKIPLTHKQHIYFDITRTFVLKCFGYTPRRQHGQQPTTACTEQREVMNANWTPIFSFYPRHPR